MWDQRYAVDDYVYGTEANDFLKLAIQRLNPQAGQRVLCLAEGEGRNAVYLAELGLDVHAVDASKTGLQKARSLAEARGVEIGTEVIDLADYDLGEQRWDYIVSIFCHLPEALRVEVHAKVCRALKPGGHFILEAYRPEQIAFASGGPKDPSMMMDLSRLQCECQSLEFVSADEIEREVHEGELHTGMGAVVQLIAMKSTG
ncbi:SAM-dependent methyltransferase [Thiomicrorhabdus heinhorstiae]|uniref:Class I SAM-dependent methyltransferase n=1 Tax=Thiomicrorhabdus heinhorstiae TaxID=2748010 RepID=A0ABS0BUS2_9GAMM|nr:class I SAM-dependent methyltransferase [Thiomicrorhabdus heinhorstiae]MBF6057585.1 class I SAM-dependent methyltransferase [Thiomicrorhabdus heinhorstiae]